MRPTLFIATLPLALAGCNYAPNTSITTTSIDGARVLDSAIRESNMGATEFICHESTSGRCYYAVFTSDCRQDAKEAATSTCTTKRIVDFAVARGESKSVAGLPPDYRHCVAQEKPTPPQCAVSPQG